MDTFSFLLFFLFPVFLLSQKATANGGISTAEKEQITGVVGAIVDQSSRIGKEAKIAMEIAKEDVYETMNQSFDLRIINSLKDPIQTAFAAKDLIDKQKVQAIVGPQTWEETVLVAEIGSQAHIPVLSLAGESPPWASERWPFLVQAARNQHKQLKAITAIIQSWEWHQVTVIYADTGSSTTGVVMPRFYDALREAGVEITNLLTVPPLANSPSLTEELEIIKKGQCRVILVDLSVPLATRLFEKAKEMDMMEKDYVWITTDAFTSLVHSINASSITSMQGIIGVRSFFHGNEPNFQDFRKRFRRRFTLKYPEEDNHDPGIYAVQAYDAVWTVFQAMSKNDKTWGQKLLDTILFSKFAGLSGQIEFTDKKLPPANIFQIINVLEMSCRTLGFWSDDRLGFSVTIDEKATYNPSMKSLKRVIWPGETWTTPRGWALPSEAQPLRIGVPNNTTFREFVSVFHNPGENNYSFEGYAIDLFREIVEHNLPYYLAYKFFPFDDKYDDLVEKINKKELDAVVGDVAIVSSRFQHAEFTHPYTEPGLVMVVPVRSRACNSAWLFMKPFTKAMWALTVVITVFNGFVVWLIERDHCPELRGPALSQITNLLWLAFSTLFSLHGEKLHSSLSRMAMVVWLFVALVITQTYTANLTSILTVQRLEPTVTNVESLQSTNAMVGHCRGSYLERYLVEVLHFDPNRIKNYSFSEDYAYGLKSGEIAAAFLDVPIAKIFVAKYCKQFIITGPTYKIGGFGFAFRRSSPLVPDINKALLNLSEHGKLRELENKMLPPTQNCEGVEKEELSSISATSYWVPFTLTGATSTVALAVYAVHCFSKLEKSFGHKINWRLMSTVITHWEQRKKWFSRKVSDVELATNIP